MYDNAHTDRLRSVDSQGGTMSAAIDSATSNLAQQLMKNDPNKVDTAKAVKDALKAELAEGKNLDAALQDLEKLLKSQGASAKDIDSLKEAIEAEAKENGATDLKSF